MGRVSTARRGPFSLTQLPGAAYFIRESYDLFYPHPVLGGDLELWSRAGAVAVEMECSTLFVIADQHGVRAGAVLAIDGNPVAQDDTDMSGYDPYRDIVREAVDSMAVRGGFPAIQLAPVNFDALYAEALNKQTAQQGAVQPPADDVTH